MVEGWYNKLRYPYAFNILHLRYFWCLKNYYFFSFPLTNQAKGCLFNVWKHHSYSVLRCCMLETPLVSCDVCQSHDFSFSNNYIGYWYVLNKTVLLSEVCEKQTLCLLSIHYYTTIFLKTILMWWWWWNLKKLLNFQELLKLIKLNAHITIDLNEIWKKDMLSNYT